MCSRGLSGPPVKANARGGDQHGPPTGTSRTNYSIPGKLELPEHVPLSKAMRLLVAAGLLLVGQLLSPLLWSSGTDSAQSAHLGEQVAASTEMNAKGGSPETHLLEYKICGWHFWRFACPKSFLVHFAGTS